MLDSARLMQNEAPRTSEGKMIKGVRVNMPRFKEGTYVGIPCRVEEGPFEDEALVSFETLDGTVSGFTNRMNIREERGQHLIKGQVLSTSGDIIRVRVEGSFFTTNGLANFSERAGAHFVPLAA